MLKTLKGLLALLLVDPDRVKQIERRRTELGRRADALFKDHHAAVQAGDDEDVCRLTKELNEVLMEIQDLKEELRGMTGETGPNV